MIYNCSLTVLLRTINSLENHVNDSRALISKEINTLGYIRKQFPTIWICRISNQFVGICSTDSVHVFNQNDPSSIKSLFKLKLKYDILCTKKFQLTLE